MLLLRNMKIGVRLVLCFLLIAVLTGVVGVIGVSSLSNNQRTSEEIYQDYGMAQGLIGQIAINFQTVRVYTRDMILDHDAAKTADYKKKITDLSAANDNLMNQFKATIHTQATTDKFNQFVANLNAYRAVRDQLVQLVEQQNYAAALVMLRSESVVKPTNAADASIEDLFNTKATNGQTKSDDMAANTADTKTMLIVIVAAAALLAIGLGLWVARSISKPITLAMGVANRMAAGDTDCYLDTRGKDEVSALSKACVKVTQTIKTLIDEMNYMSEQHDLGDIDVMLPEEKFEGAFSTMAAGVNKMVSGHIMVKKKAMACVAEFSRGNFEAPLEKFPGKKAFINDNIELLRQNLKALNADAIMLVDAALEGRLSTRADATKHEGDFRRIVDGVNRTLDAVIQPVTEASTVLNEMSRGNLSVNVMGNYKGDHAVIKHALNDTMNTIKGYIGEISQVLASVAAGDLNTGISREYRGEFAQIKESINNIIESLNSVLGDINASAEQVSAGTQQVSAGSQALSQGATEQASAIEELTASLSEVAAQTKQNAVNANQASELANTARNNAVGGNTQMKEMQQAMLKINEASASISKIIKVIDDIAFQTNLLALNAAVEAARAGQHGKGFAVVAEEVRSLAQRSAAAAKETTAMIEESVKKVKEGTQMADATALALNRIVSDVEKATDLVGGIAKASTEQATSVAQINRGVEQVSQVVQTNSATAEESAAASEELSSQASVLREMVGRFTLKGQSGHASQKSFEPASHQKALPGSKPAAIKPRISLNDREFGKY